MDSEYDPSYLRTPKLGDRVEFDRCSLVQIINPLITPIPPIGIKEVTNLSN